MEIENNISLANNLTEENLVQEQNSFLESSLGKAINSALDVGIRMVLPDFIEDGVVEVKDALFEGGFKEGVNTAINNAIDLGKSAIGIFTGDFENVSQMQSAVKNGGLIDGVSDLLDVVVDKVSDAGLISNSVAETIKQGKDVILNNVESNIENTFSKQYEAIENVDNYISSWKESFEKQDFNAMEKEYQKLEEKMQDIVPITKTIEEAKTIEVLHNLIKNNGQDFNLSNEQLELVKKLK